MKKTQTQTNDKVTVAIKITASVWATLICVVVVFMLFFLPKMYELLSNGESINEYIGAMAVYQCLLYILSLVFARLSIMSWKYTIYEIRRLEYDKSSNQFD